MYHLPFFFSTLPRCRMRPAFLARGLAFDVAACLGRGIGSAGCALRFSAVALGVSRRSKSEALFYECGTFTYEAVVEVFRDPVADLLTCLPNHQSKEEFPLAT